MHKAECLPGRPSSTPERLELNGAEEEGHQLGVLDLNELVEFSAHVRDIEKLCEGEILGYRLHYLVYGFVFFHEGLFGKNLGEFPRAASLLVRERQIAVPVPLLLARHVLTRGISATSMPVMRAQLDLLEIFGNPLSGKAPEVIEKLRGRGVRVCR